MQARKRWRLSEASESQTTAEQDYKPQTSGYRRSDGTINLHLFKAECLSTPEECAEVFAELTKMSNDFSNRIRNFHAEKSETGYYTAPALYRSTQTLWSLAKITMQQVQTRRSKLRRVVTAVESKEADKSDERRFVLAAKQMLTREQYLEIWKKANSMREAPPQPSRDTLKENTNEKS